MTRTEIRLYGRGIDRPRIELGVAMDNLTNTLAFCFQLRENPYIAGESCAAYLKTDTLRVPLKLPMTVTRENGEAWASVSLTSAMIPYEGSFTGQLQLEAPNTDMEGGGYYVWQSYPFELLVVRTLDADKAIDSQLGGAYDSLFQFEQTEAARVRNETAREASEAGRRETMNRLQGSLNRAIELIQRIEGTLEEDQPGVGIAAAAVDLATGHLIVTLTSGRTIDAGRVTGEKGDPGEPGEAVELAVRDQTIQWRYASEADYRPLVPLSALAGADGREVSLRIAAGQVQWRLGSGEWSGLIALEDLKGADGASFVIKGLYASIGDLEAAHPEGAPGDAYAVGTAERNTTYLWDLERGAWTDVGGIKGEKGDAMNFDSLTPEQKDALCRFTDAYKDTVDTLSSRVDQDLRTTASPVFHSLSAGTVTAERVTGAVYN